MWYLLLLLLLLSSPAYGQLATDCTLYTAPTGSDSNNGLTPATPKTPAGANLATVPGSVVCMMGGTYNIAATVYLSKNGTASQWIVWKPYGDSPPIWQWTNPASPSDYNMVHIFAASEAAERNAYVELRGLTLDGGVLTGGASSSTVGIKCQWSYHIRIIGNTFRNFGASGISSKWCDYMMVAGNHVTHVGYQQGTGSGITLNSHQFSDALPGFHSYVLNNIVSGAFDNNAAGVDGNGIIMDLSNGTTTPGTANTPPVLVANNVVYQNGGRCIQVFITSNIWVVHNTCYSNALDLSIAGIGEFQVNSGINSYFINNISSSWNSRQTYQQLGAAVSNITYYKDLYFGGVLNFTPSDATQFINSNPLFIAPPTLHPTNDGQYATAVVPGALGTALQLQAGSPAIDTGYELATLTGIPAEIMAGLQQYAMTDINGVSRPRGGAVDLGAYEFIPPPCAGGTRRAPKTATP